MSEHSPGPWVWEVRDGEDALVDGAGVPVFEGEWCVGAEDARLIAAAPELLAGLKWAMRILDVASPCDTACTGACPNHRYRALIRRIEGGGE